MNNLVNDIKAVAIGAVEAGKPCAIYTGEITSINPFTVRISDDISLSKQLVLTGMVQTLINEDVLKTGDKVALLRYPGGQNFLVIDGMEGWENETLNNHISDVIRHITPEERTLWNSHTSDATINAHLLDEVRHITANERTTWDNKVDKVTGKELSSNDYTSTEKTKLSGIATGANKYTHPANHPASIITQDINNRFVSDAEKTTWNAKIGSHQDISGKVDKVTGKQLSTEDYTTVEKTKLSGIEANANNYTHPTNHPASIITQTATARFVTDAEKSTWNSKTDDTTAIGHINNADIHVTSAQKTTWNTHTTDATVNNHKADAVAHITAGERTSWNGKVDKVTGKELSSNDYSDTEKTKLAGIATGANKYVHPAKHTAGEITQDLNNRFVTDTEKSTWNNKTDDSNLTAHIGDATHIIASERIKWDKTPVDLTAHIGDLVKHITANERTAWNAKADLSALTAHTGNADIHVLKADKTGWDTHKNDGTIHVTTALKNTWNSHTTDATANAHISNTTPHASSTEKTNWTAGYTHISDLVKHITAGERTDWNAKATVANIATHAGLTTHITEAERTAWDNKVDKVTGKELSSNDYTSTEKTKLSGIATGANKYTHPANHPASIITQDINNRFVSDAEKTTWNAKIGSHQDISGKVDKVTGKQLSTEDYTTVEKTKLSGIEANANNYTHPTNHPASIITSGTVADARLPDTIERTSTLRTDQINFYGCGNVGYNGDGSYAFFPVQYTRLGPKRGLLSFNGSHAGTNPNEFKLFSINKMSSILGVTFKTNQTRVTGEWQASTVDRGYGAKCYIENDNIQMGRIYNLQGAYGGWSETTTRGQAIAYYNIYIEEV